ncbi:MAG: hypothetical protein DMF53_12100 [Acidobacteria bacterium]|nr:MAG: hypothetical protein DMF53_12100 [Acidobacteriota bacterium]
MFCPECGGEYREGFTHCADCDVDLVESLPTLEEMPDTGLVTVLETDDPAELALAESLLQEAGIPFVKRGDYLHNQFVFGALGLGFNDVAGAVVIQVAEEHAEAADQALEEIRAVNEESQGGEELAAELE